MSILIFLIISYILLSISLMKVFQKAGEESWKALVPGLNFVVWCKIIGRPAWWAALLLIPIVNIFILAGMNVDMVRSFGKYSFGWAALAVIYAPIAFFLLGSRDEEKYLGPTLTAEKAYQQQIDEARSNNEERKLRKLLAENPYKKSVAREWAEAIVFAVFAAAFIRMFLIEAYVIPTPSMEGSLLVGDFLFVSKAHYGIRTPMTVVQFPLVHNTLPVLGSESYLKNPSLKYHRLPALENIDRNDPIVFNWPVGDSIYLTPSRSFDYESIRREGQNQRFDRQYGLRTRPIDKKDHYIKRAIAIPGDEFEIRDKQVYINGQQAPNPSKMQFNYRIIMPNGGRINSQIMRDLDVNLADVARYDNDPNYSIALNSEQVKALEAAGAKVEPSTDQATYNSGKVLFPHDPVNYPDWTVDNYGPLTIPKSGMTVTITPKNLSLYRRIIDTYEDNDIEVKNGRIFINGEQTTQYTFKQDYYWAMGDNRHNSEDSRFWGFVPGDHIVGKPLFIWFSTKNGSIANGINWGRIFTSAQKM